MPESRGRKKKPNKGGKRAPARRSPGVPSPHDRSGPIPGRYAPGRLQVNEEQIGGLLLSGAAPDLIVELLPAMLWLHHMSGQRGNVCVDGCMILHHAYRQLGIRSEPRAVDLMVKDDRRQRNIAYGRPDPHWDERSFHGHCVLWLPGSRRFLDPTVEQYPEVRRYRLGPMCGRSLIGQGSAEQRRRFERGILEPGGMIGVKRGDLLLAYTVVDDGPDWIINGDLVQETLPRYHRAGTNLAAHTLMLLRQPEVHAQIRSAPYPRLHALLTALGDTEPHIDPAGDYYFDLGDGPVQLDEIAVGPPVPAAPVGAAEDGAVPTPRPGDAIGDLTTPEIRAVVEEVETSVRALVIAGDPVLLFEPERALYTAGAYIPWTTTSGEPGRPGLGRRLARALRGGVRA